MEQQVIALVESRGTSGLTCFEVENLLAMKHQTASARIREAVLHGMLVDAGFTRPSPKGDESTVYVRTQRAEPLKTPKKNMRPTKDQVEALLKLFREVRKERGVLPEGCAPVCRWLGAEFDIPPEPIPPKS